MPKTSTTYRIGVIILATSRCSSQEQVYANSYRAPKKAKRLDGYVGMTKIAHQVFAAVVVVVAAVKCCPCRAGRKSTSEAELGNRRKAQTVYEA